MHGGPFANIAHGCNSVIATKAALGLGDVAITEAGFGADLGAEKFFDVMCRQTGLAPDLSIVVATVRALKYHGGQDLADLEKENVEAVRAGMPNLTKHVRTLPGGVRAEGARSHQPIRCGYAGGDGSDRGGNGRAGS